MIKFIILIWTGLVPHSALFADGDSWADRPEALTHVNELSGQSSRQRPESPKKTPAYPTFAKLTPYAAARESLLRHGWQPASTPDADTCEQGNTRCQGRPEMEACSGTGEANCLFLWRRNAMVIAVITFDNPPLVSAVRCHSGCR